MGASVKLGRVLGVPVRLHFSWFVAFILFIILFEGHFEERYRFDLLFAGHFEHPYRTWSVEDRWIVAAATSLLLFLSVLVHELSHSLLAVRRGIPIRGITLFIFGGVSETANEADRPSTEFLVAAVGPVSSIVLGFLFLGVAQGTQGLADHVSAVALILVSANIGLGLFNMMPAFPMDGGRVLRAAVWGVTGNYGRATTLAARGGQAIGLAMIIAGITLTFWNSANLVQGIWLLIMGIFLHAMAAASHRQVRLQERLSNLTARDVMATSCPAAPCDTSLRELTDEHMAGTGYDFVVLLREGVAVGVVTRRLLGRVPNDRWADTSAASIMVPLGKPSPITVSVEPDQPAHVVMALMDGRNARHALVVQEGILVGFIGRDSLRRRAGLRA